MQRELPEFVLKLDGSEAPPEIRDDVLRVEVHEEIGRLARAEVLLSNWRESATSVKHTDAAALSPGTRVEIHLGTDENVTPVFDGTITGLAGQFGPGREPALTVDCRCRGALLTGGRRSRVFENASDADAASAIAGDYGLTADADTGGPVHPALVQFDVTDWEFLRDRAEALGRALYVRGDTLMFRAPAAAENPVAEFEWGETLLEVEIEQQLGPRAASVTATAWDPERLETSQAEVAAGGTTFPPGDRPAVAAALDAAGWPLRATRLTHPGPLSGEELDAWALGAVDRDALAHVAGRVRAWGNARVRIDATVRLGKLGDRFSGTHYVTAVRHILAPGAFHTEFQIDRPRPTRGPRDGGARGWGAGGPLVPGRVEAIDDPNGWGRVRVAFPWLDGTLAPIWARLALPAAGGDRGFFFIPEVGDEVVIGFFGDARFPVVLGSLWNGQHAPPVSLDAATNAVRSIVSRAGHRFTFDDSDGAPLVRVETAAGQSVLLDDASGGESIVLKDKTGNTLTLDTQGIALVAASGKDVSIGASGGKVKIEAALDLQAAATLGITGALVKINS